MDSRDPDLIRQDIKQTRAALSDKLHRLESEVRDTAHEARELVEDKIEHVRETISLSHQVNERPWTFFAGAIVLGAAVGHLLSRVAQHEQTGPMLAHRVAPLLETELKMLKGAAFTMVVAMMRDVARETVKPVVTEMVENALQSVLGSATATAPAR